MCIEFTIPLISRYSIKYTTSCKISCNVDHGSLVISKILSTEISNMMPAGGIPTVTSIVDNTITPAPGIAGVPIEANRSGYDYDHY